MKPKDVYTRNKYENKGSSLRLEEAYIHTNRQKKKRTHKQTYKYSHIYTSTRRDKH